MHSVVNLLLIVGPTVQQGVVDGGERGCRGAYLGRKRLQSPVFFANKGLELVCGWDSERRSAGGALPLTDLVLHLFVKLAGDRVASVGVEDGYWQSVCERCWERTAQGGDGPTFIVGALRLVGEDGALYGVCDSVGVGADTG